MRPEAETVDRLSIFLLGKGPKKCVECPIANRTASKVAQHIIQQDIDVSHVFEPYAQVMGECTSGISKPGYPHMRQKLCGHPELGNYSADSVENLTESIIENLINGTNHA